MSLAGGRAPRKTAGNRLSGLLEAEEEDEFYQTTYGGFTEESGDDEYQGDQSDTEDEVDSDFDIDEGDEPSSDGEAEEPRRKRRVVTKAYKEPLKSLRPRKVSTIAGSSQKTREEKVLLPLELQDDGSDREVAVVTDYGAFVKIPGCRKQGLVHQTHMSSCRVDKPSEIVDVGDKVWVKLIGREMKNDRIKVFLSMKVVNQGTGKDLGLNSVIIEQEERRRHFCQDYTGQITLKAVLNTTCKKCGCRKSMRQSTAEHTRQTFLRVQERQGQSRRRKGPHCERPLTQEELLREAKITEELNLRSLETYERLEADKKKQVHKKRKCPGPIITYHSMAVPLVGELGPKEETVDVEGLDPAPTASALPLHAGTGPIVPPARCSRTFITFSDDATFEEWFPQGHPPKIPVREVCPVTHRPALYRDPVTDIPYATARAFKIIREAYKKYITAHGLPPTASALGPGPPPPEPLPGSGPRAMRQKIVIK
uniref:Vacuolar protein sorting-associated protein 72 homolog n=1 Tax=Otolemur garnettii TaxID=30611 RepID=B4UT05_OTOGA|nr:transcription factor-like 1 (predicted) [Otolemur garnettii]